MTIGDLTNKLGINANMSQKQFANCMAVETGSDADCNAATADSIIGMTQGIENIPEVLTKAINDTL